MREASASSVIALPNESSVRFHERHDFRHAGTLTEVGHKFGRYLELSPGERDVLEDLEKSPRHVPAGGTESSMSNPSGATWSTDSSSMSVQTL